jgi:hypothetical protein
MQQSYVVFFIKNYLYIYIYIYIIIFITVILSLILILSKKVQSDLTT